MKKQSILDTCTALPSGDEYIEMMEEGLYIGWNRKPDANDIDNFLSQWSPEDERGYDF